MGLAYYKKNQGTITRTALSVFLMIVALAGCYALYNFVPPLNMAVDPPQPTFWAKDRLTIDFFNFKITNGLIISVGLFLAISFLIYIWILNRPKTVDFLIDTEGELKKVSWPPRQQYMGSSVAVIVSVVLLGLFLIFADEIIEKIIRYVIKLY